MTAPECIVATAADRTTTELLVFAPPSPRTLVLLYCGLGIEAGYYTPFAQSMVKRGHAVAVLEARGVGSSSVRAGRDHDFGYTEFIEQDVPAAFEALRKRFTGIPWLMAGHSLGAQVSVLCGARLPEQVVGLVLVAGGSPSLGGFSGSMRLQIGLAGLVFPITAAVLGWFPGERFGFGRRESKTFMLEWSRCLWTDRYRSWDGARDFDRQAAEQTRPVIAITIEGDTWAPPEAMARLTRRMPRASVQSRHLPLGPGKGAPHFRWARAPEHVVEAIDRWLDTVVGDRPASSNRT